MKIKGNLWGKFTVTVIILILIFGIKINAETQEDIFSQILKSTNSKIIEVGLNTTYQTNCCGKNQCIEWLKKMNLYKFNSNKNDEGKVSNKLIKDDGTEYCLEFKQNNIEGYIESYKELKSYKISISIVVKTNDGKLNLNQKKVVDSINNEHICYKYVKAKSRIDNINVLNNQVRQVLIKNSAENLECIKVNKSFSTTAFIKKLDYILDNNKKVSLNCAACKYSDGNYIIIGTPIISIAY